MGTLLSDTVAYRQPKITQSTGRPGSQVINGIDQLLVVLPAKQTGRWWRKLPQGNRLQALARRKATDKDAIVSTHLGNKRHTSIHVGKADTTQDAFASLSFARNLVGSVRREKAGTVGIWVLGFDDATQTQLIEYVTAAALAAAYPMPRFKEKASPTTIRSIKIIGTSDRLDLSRVVAEADGNNLARSLTALPANKLDATEYVKLIRELSKDNGWQFKKYGVGELRKMGAGAFLAVAQGNDNDSAAIVRICYRPGEKNDAPRLCLVGKGIIFDTGGTNLKPFNSMLDMHIDMGGSAVALGTLLALSSLKVPYAVDCVLAITENRTGPNAYKSQDVITALNGKTIQTIHTDAEGRMALADALTMACEDKPELVVDYATLTGACVNAVTSRYSGVFTNRSALHPKLKKAGRDSGERVWPFPIGKEFIEDLKSDTADIQQCSPSGGGDHILAGSFLAEFVDDDVPWVHVDLSACSRKGGLAHVPTEITGFGVRFSTQMLLDADIW